MNTGDRRIKGRTLHAESTESFAFDPNTDTWQLSLDCTVRLKWLAQRMAEPACSGARKTLFFYARTYSPGHTQNMCELLKVLVTSVRRNRRPVACISEGILLNFRSSLTEKKEWYLGNLRGFLKKWYALGYPGVDAQAIELLTSWKLKGNPKGESVLLRCPYKGALSDLEFESTQAALLLSFEEGRTSIDDFALVTLFTGTGRRPRQLGDLKALDLIEARSSDGRSEFVLKIPRRKQKGERCRAAFRPFALSHENGLMLKALIRSNEARLKSVWGDASETARNQLPLFPNWKMIVKASTYETFAATQLFHRSTVAIETRLIKVVKSLKVTSERTLKLLHVTPLRCRRTIATRAARAGYGPLMIAELLDHTDDQNARVYTENVPERVDAINKAIGSQMSSVIQAFAGVLVDSESVAERGGDPRSKIRTTEGKPIGNCGNFAFCGAFAPFACYTCKFFNAWLDGPHEEVLEHLTNQQFQILQRTGDATIAHACDRTIFAVTEVIGRCKDRFHDLRKEGKARA
jgi:integrase